MTILLLILIGVLIVGGLAFVIGLGMAAHRGDQAMADYFRNHSSK